MSRAAALVALLALGACSAGHPAPEAAAPVSRAAARRSTTPVEVREMERLVQRRRARIGCSALIWDERLAEVARRHSRDMARRRFFSHTNPDGRDPFERMSEAGIDYRAAAENIAEGSGGAGRVFEGWMDSPGHRRNLENCAYTHHGIGLHENRWTHVFVRHARGRR